MSSNTKSSYSEARRILFTDLDNHKSKVCCVYTGKCTTTSSIPDSKEMNCEHSWPQSRGARGIAKADLHHLFPAISLINSIRGNFPFCIVEKIEWQGMGSKLGYNKNGEKCFEPPISHRGNLARALFYFSVRYEKQILENEENTLLKWNKEDSVDREEQARDDLIEHYQHNRNLFVDYPQLIDLIGNF
ncbi:MAG: endonuclease [Oligoflexia bacterium]|nr:endonuclease [Oligoflexia bacterium]